MSTYTSFDHRLQKQLLADVAQLTHPIHMAAQRKVITHLPLIDQLHAAALPGNNGPSSRRTMPNSRPPLTIAALDALITIGSELDQWRTRLSLPAASIKRTLNRLPTATPNLAPAIAEWLTLDVHSWWHTAAIHSGWRPAQLIRLR